MINQPDSSLRKGKALLGLQIISDFGDQITAALLALCVLDISQSTNEVGLIYFINTVGFILFTMLGGYLGDRVSKRNILCYSDLGRGFVVLLMIAALMMKSIALIYVASFFLSLLGSIHRPVKLSLWAKSIPLHRLELYNCFSELSTHASVIIGPLIASLLVAHRFTNWGFALDALTFFVCAIIFFVIIADEQTPSISAPVENKSSDWLSGFKLIARDHELSRFVSYDALQMVAHGAFNATFLVLAQRDFGWSKAHYSYYLAITAGFAIFGAFLGTTKYVAQISAGTRLVGCTLISAVALGMVLYFKTFLVGSIMFGICHTVAIVAMVVTKTKVQMHGQKLYPQSLASILAARTIFIKIATLLGTGLCLVLSNFMSLELTLWFFLLPLAVGFVPFVAGQKILIDVNNCNEA